MHSHAALPLSFDDLSRTLLKQTECCGGSPEAAPLPSVDGVINVVHDLRELLFPGIRRVRRPGASSAAFEMHDLLSRVHSRLRMEIGRAIVHSRHTHLKLHTESPEPAGDSCPSRTTDAFLGQLPVLQQLLHSDVQAAFQGDPAARSVDEILLCYPGIEAVMVYRIAHQLLQLGVPYLPRIMTEWAHRETGVDIHPGASIGRSFFIDHGTGVVIGETCKIGDGVTLYQGVTLGAWSFSRDEDGNLIRGVKRHPTLEDRVTVYSNATILGGTTVIGAGSQIGSSVSLNRSVPPNTVVTIERPSLRFREAG
jgi:serine O-acetyltransferase